MRHRAYQYCKDMRTLNALFLRLSILAIFGVSLSGQQPTEFHNGKEVSSNQIIIRTKSNSSANLFTILASLLPADTIKILNQQLGLYVVHSPNRAVAELIATYAGRADLAYAEPNFTVKHSAVPNDPSYSQLWGMQKISAPGAWDISTGGKNMVAGVIDTGISYNHPDLAANVWSAPTAFTVTLNGTPFSCPAGSHGLNSITMTCDPADDNGHGTHVAGTIGAVGNNGVGVVGVNWNASIMGLKFLDASGSGAVSDAIKSIEFAIQVKRFFAGTSTPVNIRVLSNSWGGDGFSQSLLDEINSAGANDMLFVVAAGNSAANDDIIPFYPASHVSATQITVAATDSNDLLASFSNFGISKVHLAAPGGNILSTYRTSSYASLSGTSMATPHVSGAALLVAGACPSLNTAALKNTLLSNVDQLSNLIGFTATGGRLNVNRAIASCALSAPPALSSLAVTPSTIQSGQTGIVTVTLTTPAGAGGLPVSLASSYPAGANVPPLVTVPQGATQIAVNFTAGAVTVSSAFTITATYLGVIKSAGGTINPATTAAGAIASFIRSDATTQGNWKGKYGTDGYSVMGDGTQNPAYVVPANAGLQYIWTTSTSDIRALQKVAGTDRVAATWYGQPTFIIDLNITDQNTHQLAIYCMDWDSAGRSQNIDILDAGNNVLDTRPLNGFSGGQYLIWNVSGHVKIRATGLNSIPLINGIFFGGSAPAATATYLALDTATQGNWKGKYGTDGYSLMGDGTKNPAYVVPVNGGSQYTWAASTTDIRALQKVAGTDRIAATWYGQPSFSIDLNITDLNPHQLAIYCMDWDNSGRSQTIDILDANNNVLDTRSMSSFVGGKYLVWNVTGHVKIRATGLSSVPVIEGIFLGGSAPTSTASFLALDTSTQGNWKGKYGKDGYSLMGDGTLNPAYVVPVNGGFQYTWNASTSDIRALQKAAGTGRIAAAWYGQPSFIVDLNITDQNSHQIAIYCVDWDSSGRSQTIDILDANNNVLDTRTLTGFTGGQYLVWNVSGHVKIRATGIGSSVPVIEGLFFGGSASAATASFLALDTTTQGNWKGKYGADGYSLMGDGTQNPAYVVPVNSGSQYVWSSGTSDIRALQKVTGTYRIAATWYGQPSFSIDLNITDSNPHQVAIYCMDWDNAGRSLTIDILDVNNNVLDTRTLNGFAAGQYLVWNVTGHVKIRATGIGSVPVIEGVFFR